ncbi:MAG: cation diffusion facilitator family transporter [Thiohalocapsa sp.]
MHDHRTDKSAPDGSATGKDSRYLLTVAIGLTAGFAIVELIGGWLAGSLALISDAGHMFTDSLALALAAIAAWIALRPPTRRKTYGFGQLETVAAFVNALFMVGIVVFISVFAVERLLTPRPVAGHMVTWIALIGLAVNILAAWLLMGGRRNLNVRAALVHVIGDLLGSVAALISGLVIMITDWTPIDPILSLLIGLLILGSSFRILRDALHGLLGGVPAHLDAEQVERAISGIDGVVSLHDLHIWSLSGERTALSVHLIVAQMTDWPDVLERVRTRLDQDFGIRHVTLQPEPMGSFAGDDSPRRASQPST